MKNRIYLGVNIDHIATIRQARGTLYPDPVASAQEAILGGADSITVHLREDKRHIQPRDVELLKQTLNVPLNLEMAVTPAMVEFACRIKPEKCCLVPEKREELTTEGGLNVINQQKQIQQAIALLQAQNIEVSLFIEANPDQIKATHEVGAPVIELHTGTYADATDLHTQQKQLNKLIDGAELAHELGLIVNAGHGLHYQNTEAITRLPHLHELNIGHAIIARALQTGLQQAVRDMQTLLWRCRA